MGVARRSHGAGLLANAISLNVDGGVIVNAALTTDGAEMARLGDFRFAPPTTLGGYTAVRGAAVVATIGVTVAEAIRQGQGTPVALHVFDAVTLREQGMFAIAADVLNLLRAGPRRRRRPPRRPLARAGAPPPRGVAALRGAVRSSGGSRRVFAT